MSSPPSAYTAKVVIPLPTDDELMPANREKLKLANDLNVARMLAGTDDMFNSTIGIVQAVFQAKGVDVKVRELIILRSAKLLNCPYEWQANIVMAKNAVNRSTSMSTPAGQFICQESDSVAVPASGATTAAQRGAHQARKNTSTPPPMKR